MANTFIHGKQTTFAYAGALFDVLDVTWNHEIDAEDITHTGANGAQVMLGGVERADVAITFIYDTQNRPTVAPQNFKPGTVATLHQKPDGTDDFNAAFLVTKLSWKGGPQAKALQVTVEAKSTGAITVPAS